MKKNAILAVLLALLLPSAATAHADSEGSSLRGAVPVQLFMQICVVGRRDPGVAARHAEENGFEVATEELARKYLGESHGRAWWRKDERGEFGVALLDNRLCSVFIHQGDPLTLQKSMESWLPPEESGFTFKKVRMPQTGSLETTAYRIYRSDELIEQWLITTNAQPESQLVAIMSYQPARLESK